MRVTDAEEILNLKRSLSLLSSKFNSYLMDVSQLMEQGGHAVFVSSLPVELRLLPLEFYHSFWSLTQTLLHLAICFFPFYTFFSFTSWFSWYSRCDHSQKLKGGFKVFSLWFSISLPITHHHFPFWLASTY